MAAPHPAFGSLSRQAQILAQVERASLDGRCQSQLSTAPSSGGSPSCRLSRAPAGSAVAGGPVPVPEPRGRVITLPDDKSAPRPRRAPDPAFGRPLDIDVMGAV